MKTTGGGAGGIGGSRIVCRSTEGSKFQGRKNKKWCGRQSDSGKATRPDPDRIQGLVEIRRRPETGGEVVMHFVHAVNWIWSTISELAKIEAPLRNMLEEDCLKGTRRTHQ